MHRQRTRLTKGWLWPVVLLVVVLIAGGIWFGLNQQAQARAQQAASSSRVKARSVARSRSAAKASQAEASSRKAEDPVYKDFADEGLSYHQVQVAKQMPITAVGDSVMLGSAYLYKEIFPKVDLDATVSRQIYQAPELFKSLAASGRLADTVIIGLGTNGTFTDEAFQSIMTSIGSKRQVYWINVRSDAKWTNEVNRDLVKMAKRYSNLHIVDWYAASAGHDNWLTADKTHPTTEGQLHYVATVAKAVLAKSK